MAIQVDTSLPLSFKPAQIESPLAAYSQALDIKNQQQKNTEGAQKIQENALTLQQQQRGVDYQRTFTDSLQKHTKQNEDGTLATDWGGIQGDITNAGFGPEALKLSGDRAAAQAEGLKLLHEQNQINLDHVQGVSRVLGSLPTVDQTAPADVQAIQKQAWGAAAPAAVASLVAQGHMSQQDGAAMIKQIQDAGGWTPQFAAMVDQKRMEGLTAEQQIMHVQNGINAAREGDVSKATIAHLNAETDAANATRADKARSDAAARLSQVSSPEEYDAAKAKLDPKLAADLPDSKGLDFSPKALAATQERILKAGMNSEQIAQHEVSKANSVSLALSRETMEQVRKENLEIKKQMLAGQPSPAQKLAANKIDSYEKMEAPLWKQASQLSTALGDGSAKPTVFIGEQGGPEPMSKKASGNEQDAAGLTADMKTRLQNAKAQLKSIINKKYDLADAHGAEPTVSREDALAAVEKIGAASGKAATPAATPAAKPAPAAPANKGQPKPLDATTALNYLKKAGWTSGAPTQAQKDKASQLAKADNYTP